MDAFVPELSSCGLAMLEAVARYVSFPPQPPLPPPCDDPANAVQAAAREATIAVEAAAWGATVATIKATTGALKFDSSRPDDVTAVAAFVQSGGVAALVALGAILNVTEIVNAVKVDAALMRHRKEIARVNNVACSAHAAAAEAASAARAKAATLAGARAHLGILSGTPDDDVRFIIGNTDVGVLADAVRLLGAEAAEWVQAVRSLPSNAGTLRSSVSATLLKAFGIGDPQPRARGGAGGAAAAEGGAATHGALGGILDLAAVFTADVRLANIILPAQTVQSVAVRTTRGQQGGTGGMTPVSSLLAGFLACATVDGKSAQPTSGERFFLTAADLQRLARTVDHGLAAHFGAKPSVDVTYGIPAALLSAIDSVDRTLALPTGSLRPDGTMMGPDFDYTGVQALRAKVKIVVKCVAELRKIGGFDGVRAADLARNVAGADLLLQSVATMIESTVATLYMVSTARGSVVPVMSAAEKYVVARGFFSELLAAGHACALARADETFAALGGGTVGFLAVGRSPATYPPFAIDPVQAADALLVLQRAVDREVMCKGLAAAAPLRGPDLHPAEDPSKNGQGGGAPHSASAYSTLLYDSVARVTLGGSSVFTLSRMTVSRAAIQAALPAGVAPGTLMCFFQFNPDKGCAMDGKVCTRMHGGTRAQCCHITPEKLQAFKSAITWSAK